MRPATAQSIRISDKETLEWSSSEPDASPKSTQDLERIAHWLDSVFEIPGIRLRFGIDAALRAIAGGGRYCVGFSLYLHSASSNEIRRSENHARAT